MNMDPQSLRHLHALRDFVRNLVEQAERSGGCECHRPPSLLLVGPPGAGKTYLVKQMSNVCEMPLFGVHTHQLTGPTSLRNLFLQARELDYPSLFFLDDIDYIFSDQDSSPCHDNLTEALRKELYKQLGPRKLKIYDSDSKRNPVQYSLPATPSPKSDSGYDEDTHPDNNGLILVAATSSPWLLYKDHELLSRFRGVYLVGLPDRETRFHMLKFLLQKVQHNLTEKDFWIIADKTEGYTPSDLMVITKSLNYEQFSFLFSMAGLGEYGEDGSSEDGSSVPSSEMTESDSESDFDPADVYPPGVSDPLSKKGGLGPPLMAYSKAGSQSQDHSFRKISTTRIAEVGQKCDQQMEAGQKLNSTLNTLKTDWSSEGEGDEEKDDNERKSNEKVEKKMGGAVIKASESKEERKEEAKDETCLVNDEGKESEKKDDTLIREATKEETRDENLTNEGNNLSSSSCVHDILMEDSTATGDTSLVQETTSIPDCESFSTKICDSNCNFSDEKCGDGSENVKSKDVIENVKYQSSVDSEVNDEVALKNEVEFELPVDCLSSAVEDKSPSINDHSPSVVHNTPSVVNNSSLVKENLPLAIDNLLSVKNELPIPSNKDKSSVDISISPSAPAISSDDETKDFELHVSHPPDPFPNDNQAIDSGSDSDNENNNNNSNNNGLSVFTKRSRRVNFGNVTAMHPLSVEVEDGESSNSNNNNYDYEVNNIDSSNSIGASNNLLDKDSSSFVVGSSSSNILKRLLSGAGIDTEEEEDYDGSPSNKNNASKKLSLLLNNNNNNNKQDSNNCDSNYGPQDSYHNIYLDSDHSDNGDRTRVSRLRKEKNKSPVLDSFRSSPNMRQRSLSEGSRSSTAVSPPLTGGSPQLTPSGSVNSNNLATENSSDSGSGRRIRLSSDNQEDDKPGDSNSSLYVKSETPTIPSSASSSATCNVSGDTLECRSDSDEKLRNLGNKELKGRRASLRNSTSDDDDDDGNSEDDQEDDAIRTILNLNNLGEVSIKILTLGDVLKVVSRTPRSISDEEIKRYTDFMVWFANVAKSACPHSTKSAVSDTASSLEESVDGSLWNASTTSKKKKGPLKKLGRFLLKALMFILD